MLHCNNGGRGGRLRGVARSAARDAVKKEALRKAGIGCHEIVAGHTTPSELRALVEKLVQKEVEKFYDEFLVYS